MQNLFTAPGVPPRIGCEFTSCDFGYLASVAPVVSPRRSQTAKAIVGIDQNDVCVDYLTGRERRAEALRHLQALVTKVKKDME